MCSLGLDCVMRSRVHLGWPDINSTRFAETYVWPQSSESAPRQQQRRRIQNQHELCICYVWTQWFAGRKLLNLGFLFGGESTHGQMNIRQNIAFHFANTHAIWKRSTLGRANVPNVHMHFIHLTQSECVCVCGTGTISYLFLGPFRPNNVAVHPSPVPSHLHQANTHNMW